MRGSLFEMAAILAIVLLLFGPTQLPKLIKSIKQGKFPYTFLVTNHVNSYVRKSLGGIRPYDLAMKTYPEEFFENLALEMVPSEKLNLTPGLIKKKTA